MDGEISLKDFKQGQVQQLDMEEVDHLLTKGEIINFV